MAYSRWSRRFVPPFKLGDYLQHKNDPDVHGVVAAISEDGKHFTLRLSDDREKKDVGFWLLQKTNLLEAMARAANMDFRGPGS